MDASKKRKTEENGTTIAQTLTPEDAKKLLEPFTQSQLLTLLTTAVTTHPDILAESRTLADSDSTRRKLFVRGLGPETTTESLKSLFSSYGELEEAVVITDKNTTKSKGYGFVTFRHVDEALLALRQPSKRIDGRMTVTHLASAGRGVNGDDQSTRKIYIGNVPYEVTAERLLDYFSLFGEIEEGPLGFDKQGGKTRGFAFFVYKTEEGARNALVDTLKVIDGHQVMCKLAEDGKKGKVGVPGANSGPLGESVGGQNNNAVNSGYGPPQMGGYPNYLPPQMSGPGPYNSGPGPYNSGDFSGPYRMPPPLVGGPYSQESSGGVGGGGGGYVGVPSSGFMGQNVPPPQGNLQGPPPPMYRMPPYY